MGRKTVIIGGVAGGATAAARLRRRDQEREIIMFEKGGYISYANCGLPYYIGNVIKKRESLLLQTPEGMKKKYGIDVRVCTEVLQILRADKKVIVRNSSTGEEYSESYDELIIATGSTPLKPPIPGIDGPDIYTLWNVPDTDSIKAVIEETHPRRAAVIGGGFIGLEMAENLHKLGLKVSIIEQQDQVMMSMDFEMSQLLHENIENNQVELILKDGVDSFEKREHGTAVLLKSGRHVEADLILLSIGVKPNGGLAKEAGLTVNTRGGIVVNEFLQTSDPDIYAVGDVIEVKHYVLGTPTMIPLAGPANREARICADNIAGDKKSYQGTLGTSVAQVFDLTAASVGVNEKMLTALGKKKGVDYETVLINQKSHAGYYPGSVPLSLKMIFDRDGRILGGQIIGQDGVDKRIDTLAAAMRFHGHVKDLTELELAYAPPYSSAKDPVNMLGFTAENVLSGLVSFIGYQEMDAMWSEEGAEESITILDVTEKVERMVYSIPGSTHIPLGQLRERYEELDRNKLIIPYCAVGVRAYNAARLLMQRGFSKVRVLEGGISFYKSMHYRDLRTEEPERIEPDQMEQDQLEPELKAAGFEQTAKEIKLVDCTGLQCPGPIMKVHEAISGMADGELLSVSATDMGFARDIKAWCGRTGNTLVKAERTGKDNIVCIRKGTVQAKEVCTAAAEKLGKTLVVFSGDMDKILASFIIANGAAAMGRPVTMFFTFWGLNALRKAEKQTVKKPWMDRVFGMMMPRGAGKLKLSKMNMGGLGTAMMKKVMKDKNVDSVEALMKQAMKNGIKLVACTMSMDVMGITPEEIIEGVEFAGVASYLGDAEGADVNLFI